MRIVIQPNYQVLSNWVANYVADKINTYQELIQLYKEEQVSFENVVTFNMDEYVGISENHPESYHYFMWHNFFDHIDIPRENVNILDGNAVDLEKECTDFEKKIKAMGGVDLFLGGIGPDGHIAFNEPGSSLTSRTRVKTLSYDTILANSRFFNDDIKQVPKTALTVGVGTVMDAREVLIIISGFNKARPLRQVVEGGISHMWTVSMMQMHQHAIIACDDHATMELQVETVKYFKDIEKIAGNIIPDLE